MTAKHASKRKSTGKVMQHNRESLMSCNSDLEDDDEEQEDIEEDRLILEPYVED